MLDKIKSVFTEVLSISSSDISEDSTINNLKGWDSLTHLNIVIGLEKKIGVKFKASEIVKMNSIKNIMEILNKK